MRSNQMQLAQRHHVHLNADLALELPASNIYINITLTLTFDSQWLIPIYIYYLNIMDLFQSLIINNLAWINPILIRLIEFKTLCTVYYI